MKQNELFNKCCENIDPKTREEVWKQMDEELGRTELEQAAAEYADKHGFRVPYDGSDKYYDDVDVKASLEGFKAGAEWMKKEFSSILDKWEEHAIRGMRVGASAYHQGKIALICDLRDWMKEIEKEDV